MTPLDLARNMTASPNPETIATGVAIVLRGLTDDTADRAGWPMTPATAARAAAYLGVPATDATIAAVLRIAPTLSPAILNRGAS